MKKYLLLFVFICLLGCSSTSKQSKEAEIIQCPRVFFSLENNVYSAGKNDDIDLEEVSYKASLNNHGFATNCFSSINYKNYNLDLLIVVEPISPKTSNIKLPIFVLLYDKSNKLIDKQFFKIVGNLIYSNETLDYETTDIIGNLNILLDLDKELDSITIGFVKIN